MALPKVGVLTFHRSINYGSFWQAARLVEGLRSRGHEAELLDHECRAICSAELRCALQPELPKRTSGHLLNRYATKARKLAKAIGGLPLSTRFPLQQPELAGDYDTIVVGSDEVWNFRHPWFGSKPIFFGDGLRTPRLVSYAASFGNHGRRDGIAEDWARKLERFASLSVRDGNSEALVREGPIKLPPPRLGYADELPLEARAMLRSVLSASAIGSPEKARRQLDEFVDRTKPDELMVTAQIYDHAARLRSYELLRQAVSQASPTLAK